MAEFRHYQITAQEGCADAVRRNLAALVPTLEALEGCEKIIVLQDPSEPEAFMVFERWTSQDDYLLNVQRLDEALGEATGEPIVTIGQANWLSPL